MTGEVFLEFLAFALPTSAISASLVLGFSLLSFRNWDGLITLCTLLVVMVSLAWILHIGLAPRAAGNWWFPAQHHSFAIIPAALLAHVTFLGWQTFNGRNPPILKWSLASATLLWCGFSYMILDFTLSIMANH